MSLVTGIEYLSKTRATYSDELSFANEGLKLNTVEDGINLINHPFFPFNFLKILFFSCKFSKRNSQ
jgi:hypothetical protein